MDTTDEKVEDDFRTFLEHTRGCEASGASSLARSAPVALETFLKLPAAREVILEIFSELTARIVSRHLEFRKESAMGRGIRDTAGLIEMDEDIKGLEVFVNVLRKHVEECPSMWSPLISHWTLHMLGRMSSMVPRRDLSHGGVSAHLQFHLQCFAFRLILDLAVDCVEENLQLYENSLPDDLPSSSSSDALSPGNKTCLRSLIEVSDIYGDQFDWVIGHLGGIYPGEIVPMFLSAGLRIYHGAVDKPDGHAFSFDHDGPAGKKLRSIVVVLDHLSEVHYSRLVNSILEFAQENVRKTTLPHAFVVPYLLAMGTKSPTVRQATSDCLLRVLEPEFLTNVAIQSGLWFQRFTGKVRYNVYDELWNSLLRVLLNHGGNSEAFWTPPVLLEKFCKECLLKEFDRNDETAEMINQTAKNLVDRVRARIDLQCSSKKERSRAEGPQLAPFFESMSNHWTELLPLLFVFSPDGDGVVKEDCFVHDPMETLRRFGVDAAKGLAVYHLIFPAIHSMRYLLKKDTRNIVRSTAILLAARAEPYLPDLIPTVIDELFTDLENAVDSDDEEGPAVAHAILTNLHLLLVWEEEHEKVTETRETVLIAPSGKFRDAIAGKVPTLFSLLWSDCDLLQLLETLCRLPLRTLIRCWKPSDVSFFTESVVEAFFRLLSSPDHDEKDSLRKIVGVKYCKSIMVQLTASSTEKDTENNQSRGLTGPDGQIPPFDVVSLALRFSLERALSKTYCSCLGGSMKVDARPRTIAAPTLDHSLLEENLKMHSGVNGMVRTQTTLFKSLTLGPASSKKFAEDALKNKKKEDACEVDVGFNQGLFIQLLEDMFEVPGEPMLGGSCSAPRPSAWKYLADLLVECLAPDVLFTGIPWPDEDSARFTIERDLEVSRRLNAHPICWRLLFFIARNQAYLAMKPGLDDVKCVPPICFCSPILRSLMVVNLHYWGGTLAPSGGDCPVAAKDTKRLLSVLSQSNLCPPPLSYFGDVLDLLPPPQIKAFLSDLWAYLREMFSTPVAMARTLNAYSEGSMPVPLSPAIQNCVQRLRLIFLANMDKVGAYYTRFFGSHQRKAQHEASSPDFKSPMGIQWNL